MTTPNTLGSAQGVDPEVASNWAAYYTYGVIQHPDASMSKHSAFASGMLSLTLACSWSPPGFPQGPSIRAHAVDFYLAGPKGEFTLLEPDSEDGERTLAFIPDGSLKGFGDWSTEEALEVCLNLCYAPVEAHAALFELMWRHTYHFDDDAEDARILEERTGIKALAAPHVGFDSVFYPTYYDAVDDRWLRKTPKRKD